MVDEEVQRRAAVKGNDDPELTIAVDSMATFGPETFKTSAKQRALGFGGIPPGKFRHSPRQQW